MDKIEKALNTCKNVLDGIECDSISVASSLLQCLRIARLLNDTESIIWLQYEYGGYPRDKEGYIEKSAFEIGYNNGRGYLHEGEKKIFLTLAAELEEKIEGQRNAVNNFTTQGVSVSGELALLAMNNLTGSVAQSTSKLVENIALDKKRLSILKSKYYDYALRKSIELNFGNVANDVFYSYREKVDNYFSELSNETIIKLQAIEDKINSNNPELYSQALTTCRRLFENTATELFNKYFANYSEKKYKTKSGKEIDISGDHYINKLSAVIEKLQNKSVSNCIEGSSIIYTIDWINNLNNLQCKGVHSNITKQDAMQCIIHTYISLGDILSLQENYQEEVLNI
jgi:hypothetical protein